MILLYHWLARTYFRLHDIFIGRGSPRVRGAVIANGQLLLVKHVGGQDHWTLPGGGVKRGESAEAACRRELMEELGVTLETVQPLLPYETTHRGKKLVYELFVATTSQPLLQVNRWEIRDYGWFGLDTLPQALSPTVEHAIRQLKK